ncbi:primosomal protein N', partial [bacterium AH-315-M05]|nr:primosomal protein N' [bacterium AH-315-M05]
GRTKRGKVVIQSYDPAHSVIQNVVNNDYKRLYKDEIVQRKKFRYPPFCRLIQITVKHRDYKMVDKAADHLAVNLKKKFGKRVLGPEYPPVSRVRNQYLKKILLKLEKEASASKAKFILQEVKNDFSAKAAYRSVKVQVDVDPM